MRSFDIHAVGLALGVSPRKIDNLLVRGAGDRAEKEGVVDPGSRGRTRRLGFDAVVELAVAIELTRELEMSERRAMYAARALLSADDGALVAGSGLLLRVDLQRVRRETEARLADAVEVVVSPRRGRPPKRLSRGA
jgi:hypothetical protein